MPSSLIVPGGRPEQPAPPDPNEPIPCTTAFLVYQENGAGWHATVIDTELSPDREVTSDDITAGCSLMLIDPGLAYPERPDGRPIDVVAAFVVFQLPNGLWQVAPQIDAPLMPERAPVWSDIIAGCAVTARDIHTQEISRATAQAVINAQMQIGQAMAEQRQNAQVQQQLEADKDAARRAGKR